MTQSGIKGIKETIVEAKSDNSKLKNNIKTDITEKSPNQLILFKAKTPLKKIRNKKFSFSIKDMPAKTFQV